MKFDIGALCEELLSISNFHLDQTILTTNVLEDPDMFL
jgi:hypothetical protein